METPARHLRSVLALTLGLLLTGATASSANEVLASVRVSGLRIIGPEEVLRDHCVTDADGVLWFQLPGGASYELVTSTSDPAILNPGDGSFHAFDPAVVRAALDQVRFPLQGLDADVFLLPYPRRGALDSGAGPGVILLSPGVMPLGEEQQHAEFTHELGHVVQYQWMPDHDGRWSDYRRQRGIEDESRFSASSPHAYRPHEIFAEDFRALFGGPLANYSGSIENPELSHPATVPGLDTFLRALPEDLPGRGGLRVSANPARGPVWFEGAGSAGGALELFDVGGRRVATIAPAVTGTRTLWNWDGRDASGHAVPRGVLMARVRGDRPAVARLVWMP